jgi:hypothetical protein
MATTKAPKRPNWSRPLPPDRSQLDEAAGGGDPMTVAMALPMVVSMEGVEYRRT